LALVPTAWEGGPPGDGPGARNLENPWGFNREGILVSQTRLQKINERFREELSEMLIREISDPRLTGISITEVQVDRELAYANIYVSALEGVERSEEVLQALKHAQGFLRRELSRRVELRTFPRLRFHWDATFERAEKIERLIASLHSEDVQADSETKEKKTAELNNNHDEMDLNE
jgi:ribosome-binding factor A